MSTTVLPQLQTIEAELASQEKQLAAQLASVREKLTGIRTVMPMFDGTADVADAPAVTEEASTGLVEEAIPALDEPDEEAAVVEAPAVEEAAVEEAPKATKTKATKTTAKKATAKKAAVNKAAPKKETVAKATASKKTTARKKDGRTASWQKYTRPGVKNESIPDAVRLILETQPENEFKIADVMSALFKDDMPKSQYLKARNRISNVLSGGVRAGDWYKGNRGTYRMTAA
ncbi:MAG: hypothetical protein WBG63_07610 [Phormidesmis sp.]